MKRLWSVFKLTSFKFHEFLRFQSASMSHFKSLSTKSTQFWSQWLKIISAFTHTQPWNVCILSRWVRNPCHRCLPRWNLSWALTAMLLLLSSKFSSKALGPLDPLTAIANSHTMHHRAENSFEISSNSGGANLVFLSGWQQAKAVAVAYFLPSSSLASFIIALPYLKWSIRYSNVSLLLFHISQMDLMMKKALCPRLSIIKARTLWMVRLIWVVASH